MLQQVHILMDQNDDGEGSDVSYTCQLVSAINSRGIWYGDNPFSFTVPLLLLQLSLIFLFTRSIHHLLKRFSQPCIVSQILGGAILGPSVLGLSSSFANQVFPTKSRGAFDTFALFGFMLFVFLVGVKIDPFIIFKSGKRTVVIGTLCFFIPYTLTSFLAFLLSHYLTLDRNISKALYLIIDMLSMTAFPVVACFLAELKILNSEIGRLASSSSMICDVCHWSILTLNFVIGMALEKSFKTTSGSILSIVLLVGLIVFGIRPAALWAIRRTPEGKPVKEIYLISLIIALLLCGFTAQAIGFNAFIVSFLLGLVIPDGPPLGATLVERLDCFVSVVLMPLFFTICGLKMNVFSIKSFENFGIILLIFLSSFIGKLLGVVTPALLLRMPLRDAFSLGLIMNSKGIIELAFLNSWKMSKVMNEECFSIAVISLVALTGVISPIVKILYDPSKRFVAYKRRTILHNKKDAELRVLACVHGEDNVLAMVKLLEASNPTKQSPISLCVLHLVNLVGRSSSLLIPCLPRDDYKHGSSYQGQNRSERIFNKFRKMEETNQGFLMLHFYKGISPYATMHNDVCSLALEKRITLIIIPFHKQFTPWGKVESIRAFRHLNRNVLDKAPCSVGILIDHNSRKKYRYQPQKNHSSSYYNYRVAALFFGGADDREALAYVRRMSQNSHVLITIIRFICGTMEIAGGSSSSKMLDAEILEDIGFSNNTSSDKTRNERVSYQEEEVMGRQDVMSVFKSMEGCYYDLVVVGKRHGDSELMQELRSCSDRVELGAVADMLATDQYLGGGSLILVIQQQTRVWGLRDPEQSFRFRRTKS